MRVDPKDRPAVRARPPICRRSDGAFPPPAVRSRCWAGPAGGPAPSARAGGRGEVGCRPSAGDTLGPPVRSRLTMLVLLLAMTGACSPATPVPSGSEQPSSVAKSSTAASPVTTSEPGSPAPSASPTPSFSPWYFRRSFSGIGPTHHSIRFRARAAWFLRWRSSDPRTTIAATRLSQLIPVLMVRGRAGSRFTPKTGAMRIDVIFAPGQWTITVVSQAFYCRRVGCE
jgi:hypothetical protein